MAQLGLLFENIHDDIEVIGKKGSLRLKRGSLVTISDDKGNSIHMKFVADVNGEMILQPNKQAKKSEVLQIIHKYKTIRNAVLGGGFLNLLRK